MRNPISYLICTTERTGSYLLCDALTLTGMAGRPQECFHPARFEQLPAEPDSAAYAAYFEQMAQDCTTPNGVFGAKVQWWQLKQLVLKLRELPDYRGVGASELLQSWLPNARYIRLIRRDKVRQAVSHLKAVQTNDWWEMTSWARTPPTLPVPQPMFDADKIERAMRRILVHEAAWQLFFDDGGIQPLDIVYEDFVEAQATTTLHVLAELQIPAPPDLVIAQPRYKKQADGTSEQWVRHYHELRGTQAAPAGGAAPIEIPQEDRDILSSERPTRAVPLGPLIQPHACRQRVLRMVVYSMQQSEGLPALLARCISQDTVHTAHCVWYPPSRDLPREEGTLDWRADPVSAAAALAAADVVLIHDGEVAPQHSALLADKALVILAHHPHAQHSPWLSLGFPGVLLNPLLAPLHAFQGWPHLALPWGSPHDWDRFWMPLIARALPPSDPHGRVFHRSPAGSSLGSNRGGAPTGMKITAAPARAGERAAVAAELKPAVSCFCLTYGRPHVLEEAIYSFLQQDYAGPKEMIVLNDYADQILTFDHPEVQVVNFPRRFRTVGEKMNAAVALASYDLLFVWDDDDIYLPHRLSFSVAHFDPEKGFFKAQHAWVWNHGQLSGPAQNLFHAGSCWSRSRFDALRGYPAEGTGYDRIFEQQLESRFPGSAAAHPVAPEEIYYLYRWGGTGSFHMSGFGALKIGQNVGQAEVEAYVRQRADQGEIPRGPVPLRPCWRADYPQIASSYVANLAASPHQRRHRHPL